MFLSTVADELNLIVHQLQIQSLILGQFNLLLNLCFRPNFTKYDIATVQVWVCKNLLPIKFRLPVFLQMTSTTFILSLPEFYFPIVNLEQGAD